VVYVTSLSVICRRLNSHLVRVLQLTSLSMCRQSFGLLNTFTVAKFVIDISLESSVLFNTCTAGNFIIDVSSESFTLFNTLAAANLIIYEGWNFNSGNYLFTTDTK